MFGCARRACSPGRHRACAVPHQKMAHVYCRPMSLETASEQETVSSGWTPEGRPKALFTQPQIGLHGFLTPQDKWGDVERGNPLPLYLATRDAPPGRPGARNMATPDLRRSRKQLDRGSPVHHRLRPAPGDRQQHGVRYLKGVTCNNLGEPLGMGLWEGVPLRVVIWMARPVANVRRVLYHGYHNDDPRQLFQSTLPIWRVLEEPPGELPVLLAYKLNGEFISGKRGGPVRMVVPDAYGFKSVKWLQRVLLSNEFGANDTYRLGNNDLDSPMKTFARFLSVPPTV